MKNSKYVESFWVKKFPNGIYQLLFNTTERWIPSHKIDTTEYIFGFDSEQDSQEEYESRIQEIPDGLIPNNISFQVLTQQEKDQISFYFIPTTMVFKNGEEIIYDSNIKS